MNFFGHAHLARERDGCSAFVLGAMLPDFASMSRARLLPPAHATLASGVAFHHATDDAFHGAPSFLALQAETSALLEARGVPHGPSRAVAHVGVELVLDGALLGDHETRRAYLDAIGDPALLPHLRFRHPERFHELHARLVGYGLPSGYRDPGFVAERLFRILAPRPRLALPPFARGPVEEALARAASALDADRLLDETRLALAARRARHHAPASSPIT